MRIGQTQAPTYQQMRPLKATVTKTFPVYHELVDALAGCATFPDDKVAHVLAACAGYAYAEESTVAMIAARMGLADNRCLKIAENVDAMFICSTAYLIQSACGRVAILCYRGTEPGNFINWLTDADVNPEKVAFHFGNGQGPFPVHAGFYRNVRATRFEVVTALKRALEGRPISGDGPAELAPLQALYLTGHSLGAAMAALMTVMIRTEPAYAPISAVLKATYTFGQPMIGDDKLAAACQEDRFLAQRLFRVVYAQDLVAALPPSASGAFAHFGQEYGVAAGTQGLSRGQRRDKPTPQSTNPLDIPLAGLAFVARKLRRFRNITFQHSIDDHGPQHYIAALTPPGVTSEFGD